MATWSYGQSSVPISKTTCVQRHEVRVCTIPYKRIFYKQQFVLVFLSARPHVYKDMRSV
jgi:hypothetical protein